MDECNKLKWNIETKDPYEINQNEIDERIIKKDTLNIDSLTFKHSVCNGYNTWEFKSIYRYLKEHAQIKIPQFMRNIKWYLWGEYTL